MKTYLYKRADQALIHIEAEALFWSGTACVFVKNASAVAIVCLLPGEIVCEDSTAREVQPEEHKEIGQIKPN